MVGTLFKYDMKALSKVLVPVHLAAVAVSALACAAAVVGKIAAPLGESSLYYGGTVAGDLFDLAAAFAAVFVVLSIFGLMLAVGATFIVIIWRFYKNLFTDEGYLTLTLPVPAWNHVASKLLAGAAWMLIDAVIVGACLTVISVAMYDGDSIKLTDVLPYWILSVAGGNWLGDVGLLSVLSGALISARGAIQSMLVAFAGFALGASFATRHKVAAGIGFVVLVNWIIGLLSGFAMAALFMLLPSLSDAYGAITGALGWMLFALVAVACWLATVFVLDRKVNLA